MYLHQNELTIRDALPADTPLLCRWWNDGKVMEHAGFPQGLGTSIEKITQQLLEPNNRTHLLIIESEGLPIGEMNWRREESDHAEIGIKICESNRQEKGFGSRLIAMLCRDLFANRGIARITLDTMLENQRAQHVYEKLGFVKTGVRENCWRDQTGRLRTAVDYQLLPQQLRLPFGERSLGCATLYLPTAKQSQKSTAPCLKQCPIFSHSISMQPNRTLILSSKSSPKAKRTSWLPSAVYSCSALHWC